jgi:hypothetical protein
MRKHPFSDDTLSLTVICEDTLKFRMDFIGSSYTSGSVYREGWIVPYTNSGYLLSNRGTTIAEWRPDPSDEGMNLWVYERYSFVFSDSTDGGAWLGVVDSPFATEIFFSRWGVDGHGSWYGMYSGEGDW